MTWLRLTKALTAVLALSFPTAVHGANTCLTGASARCTAGTSAVTFASCAITDDDIDDLSSCLTAIGPNQITELSLNGNAITAVPAGLFDNLGSLTMLRLHSNKIATIDTDAFMGLTSLLTLRLDGNALTTLQANAFDHLGTLLNLWLQTNDLAVVDVDAFTGLASLTALYIHENEMTTVQAGLFGDSPSLAALWMQRNSITTVETGAFANLASLQKLFLHENQLTTVQTGLFVDLVSLQQLWLHINSITTLGDDAFKGLTSLQILYLNVNQLTAVQAGLFVDLASLQQLWLNENSITTIGDDAFTGMTSLLYLSLRVNQLTNVQAGLFDGLGLLETLRLDSNMITTIPAGLFDSSGALLNLWLEENAIETIDAEAFQDLVALELLTLNDNLLETLPESVFSATVALIDLEINNNKLNTLPANIFASLALLAELELRDNLLETLPSQLFASMASLKELELNNNALASLPVDAFTGLPRMEILLLNNNALTTLPAGIFSDIGSASDGFGTLNLDDNANLQCVPTAVHASASVALPTTDDSCVCTPAAAVTCGTEEVCTPGATGYNCVPACTEDSECDTDNGEECCPLTGVCEDPADIEAGACGDPHMTGFRGQTFDFAGKDGAWYAVVSDLPYIHLNMRVTSPVPSVPEITYITGISMVATDDDGLGHTIIISVTDPHSLDSSCRAGMTSCLADGALHVVVDGEEVLISPGEIIVAPDVAIAAVNLPGACRSFGFEKYWERKKLEMLDQAGRRLRLMNTMQDMSDWVLSDPTATNMAECAEYVAGARVGGGRGLFGHQSEHASFQIMTPTIKIRLSHGRLHQLPMRDPTDKFDLPDHLTWQMNMAIDHADISLDATGILGETLVPTVDAYGTRIMKGMDSIRGVQEDYRVKGPLGVIFAQGQDQP